MRRKTSLMLACAAAGGIWALTSASAVHAASVFTENFNSGDVTDGGIWSTGAETSSSNVSFTEPVGGPLTISVAPVTAPEAGFIQTTSLSTFNFTTSPMLATLTAPAGQSLSPTNGGDGTFGANAATYLGVDVAGATESTGTAAPSYTGASRVDTGVDKAYVLLNSDNSIQFSLEFFDPTPVAGAPNGKNNFINYTFNRATNEVPAPAANIIVTSMYLYLDAQDAQYGNFWINAGATWENTTTDTFTTDNLEGTVQAQSQAGVVPFNVDPRSGQVAYDDGNKANGYYGNLTPLQDQAIASQFSSGVAGSVEVQDGNTALGNSVNFGQLTVIVPEPASLGLVALGIPMLLRRKRRQA